MVDMRKQGKRNQINGRIFENLTRQDLESKGWIVSRWCNNVEFAQNGEGCGKYYELESGDFERCKPGQWCDDCENKTNRARCISAKQGRFRKTSTGFPDFIAYTLGDKESSMTIQTKYGLPAVVVGDSPNIIFVECKTNGRLSKEEKEKAKWYLDNNFCSQFLVAYKEKDPNDKRKNVVKYKEIENE